MQAAQKKDPGHMITVVGIGPGNPAYVLPIAREKIRTAKVLVGGWRALDTFQEDGQETIAIKADIDAVLAFIAQKAGQDEVVVMVSGDPGYYSLLDALNRTFPRNRLSVIPGISSLQMAFSRIALPWHDARLLSFHGREPAEEQLRYEEGLVLGMLTDGKRTSHTIPPVLMAHGWPADTRLYIFSRLSYDDESIVWTTLGEAGGLAEVRHGILIVEDSAEE